MITKRDKEIIKFVEEHGSITPKICSKQFFRENKEGYDQARKRLRYIQDEGHLKRYRKDPKSEAVYYTDRKLKTHDLKLLEVFAELNVFKVYEFKKERQFAIDKDRKYIVDATLIINGMIALVIEIDYTHYTNIDKIRDIISYLENKHPKKYYFIAVRLSCEELEQHNVGKYSKLFILPWNLNNFSQVISSLRSDIDSVKSSNNQ